MHPDRGRVLQAEELEEPCRSFFGTLRRMEPDRAANAGGYSPEGGFFTRGSGHNKSGGYTEIPDQYQEVIDRLLVEAPGCRASTCLRPLSSVGRCASSESSPSGGCDLAVREALDRLRERGRESRIYADPGIPFRNEVPVIHRGS